MSLGTQPSNVNDPTQAVIFRNGVYLAHGAINVAPSVPEPSTWAMMILGFAGVGIIGLSPVAQKHDGSHRSLIKSA
jgi:hypothetical protein